MASWIFTGFSMMFMGFFYDFHGFPMIFNGYCCVVHSLVGIKLTLQFHRTHRILISKLYGPKRLILFILLVLSREWMGMGEWGNGIIITSDDDDGSFPKIPCVWHQ